MARTRFDSIEALNALPDFAVIYDHENQVWQKQYRSCGLGWATPGVAGIFPVDDVELPAYLLDDGR